VAPVKPLVGAKTSRADDGLGLEPLTARSVILSVLLGSHPPELPVRSLVRTATLFGISEGTIRVALSRLAADGDVISTDGRYRLSSRLVARQRRQDEARRPAMRVWRGVWEIAVLRPAARPAPTGQPGRTGAGRAELDAELEGLGLAQLRPGVWTRPANLSRPWPDSLLVRVWRFDGRPARRPGLDRQPGLEGQSPAELAAQLWDLDGWSRRARLLLDALQGASDPARRFVVAAGAVRHLQRDPLLPPAVLPDDWPGDQLRAAYGDYVVDLSQLLRAERARHEPGQSDETAETGSTREARSRHNAQ
jgi:phenylacetic acid degradation operon negative regulatory protein